MQERTITVTLEKAKEWYSSDNATLKKIALQAFSKEDLKPFDFTKIKTFEDAFDVYVSMYSDKESTRKYICYALDNALTYSKASVALLKLVIIRQVLNKNYNLHLTKRTENQDHTWYPCLRFITKSNDYYNDALLNKEYKKIGKFENEGVIYDVLGGSAATNDTTGLGNYYIRFSTGDAYAPFGFLGCATEEIAKHFGKYFGMLIMEAMYGDIVDFKIVEND